MMLRLSKAAQVWMLILLWCVFLVLNATRIEDSLPTSNPKNDVQEIYRNLVKQTGTPYFAPPLYIYTGDDSLKIINAWTTPDGIYITLGMLQFLKTKDEIALILGHELAHAMLGHVSGYKMPFSSQVMEHEADEMGAFYMLRAGYDICSANKVWVRFRDTFGDAIDTDHPDFTYRHYSLDMPWCNTK